MSRNEALALAVAAGAGLALGAFDGDPMRVLLCLLGAAALLAKHRLGTAAWAGLALGVALGGGARAERDPQAWVPAALEGEYFAELGYRDLWDQVLAADHIGAGQMVQHRRVRDLRTMKLEPTNPLTRTPKADWDPARWTEFAEAVGAWQDEAPAPKTWRRLLESGGDRASPLVQLLRPGTGARPGDARLRWLGWLDGLLFLVALGLALRWRGVDGAAMAALIALSVGAFEALPGQPPTGLLPALLLLGAALPDRPRATGAAALWLAAVHSQLVLVPVWLLVGAAMTWWNEPARLPRLAQGMAVVLALAAVAGAANPRGPQAWSEWARAEVRYRTQDARAPARLGLPAVATQPLKAQWGNRSAREDAWSARRLPVRLLGLGLLGLIAVRLRRRPALAAATPLLPMPLPSAAGALVAPLAVGGPPLLAAAVLLPPLGYHALRGAIPSTFGEHLVASVLLLVPIGLAWALPPDDE